MSGVDARHTAVEASAGDQSRIDEFCDAIWLEDGLARNTIEAYRRDLRLMSSWLSGRGVVLERVTAEDLSAYFAALNAKPAGIRASSQARLHSSLKRFYAFALRSGWMTGNPTQHLDTPKKPQRIPKTLSEADVEALLAAPDITTPLGVRDRAMLEVLYASGLRVSELVQLALASVSLDMGVVRVMGRRSGT
jgi:integrase/recombinase XerD